MSACADALTLGRLLTALIFPWSVVRGGCFPLALFALAAASDFIDGRLARRARIPTRHGAVLDTLADVAFVLAGTVSGSVVGLTTWAVPASIVLSAGSYALASVRLTAGAPHPELARSTVGHAAGVCNYVCVGVVTGALALPGPIWPGILTTVAFGTVLVNVAAVTLRLLERPLGARSMVG